MSAANTQKQRYKRKTHYCIYCKREVDRIYEHFVRRHKQELRVQEAMSTPDRISRFWKWKRLTQEGDNYFNLQLEDSSEKKRIVKVPLFPSKQKKYFVCPRCYGRLRTCSRAQHEKACSEIFNKSTIQETNEADNKSTDLFDGAPEYYINRIRKSSNLSLFLKHLSDEKAKDNKAVLRTSMKDLIHLEDEMKKKHNIKGDKYLVTFLKAEEVDNLIETIKSSSGEQKIDKEKIFRYPSRAQRLCRLILRLTKFLTNLYYKKNLDNEANELNKFINIFTAESDIFIKNQAYRSLKLRKLKKSFELPKTTDIKKLVEKLENETPKLIVSLKDKKSPKAWRELAENVLLRLTIFNRRRGGAIEKMKLKEYTSTEIRAKTATEEAMYNLSSEEKEFLSNVKVVEIIHKCDNLVQIFISKNLQEAMEILLEHRHYADINEKNEYFFAAGRKSLTPISGVKIMEKQRKFFPKNVQKLFTATNLRKHGATTAQVLDLSNQDSEEWSSHMGHSLKVHKDYYRKQEVVNSVLKTGRILNALNNGTLKYFKGKKINEIPLSNTKGETYCAAECPNKERENEKSPVNTVAETIAEPQFLEPKPVPGCSRNYMSTARRSLFKNDLSSNEDETIQGASSSSESNNGDTSDEEIGAVSGVPNVSQPIGILKEESLYRKPRASKTKALKALRCL